MVLANRFSAHGARSSEAELMLEFGTTRNVVREALGLLHDEGLVERLQGAGTFVVTEKILHRFDVLRGVGDGFPNRQAIGYAARCPPSPASPLPSRWRSSSA